MVIQSLKSISLDIPKKKVLGFMDETMVEIFLGFPPVHKGTRWFVTLFTGGLANRLCLVVCGNKFFHRRVTENRLWKCISTGGSVMPIACRNLFLKNMKSIFKNRKKDFNTGKAHRLFARPSPCYVSRAF